MEVSQDMILFRQLSLEVQTDFLLSVKEFRLQHLLTALLHQNHGQCQDIMAAGAFVQGSSIELSADGPLKEPYSVFFQGGLTWYHAKLGIMMSVQKMFEKDLIKL